MSAREEPLQAHSTHKCQFTMSRVPAGQWNLPESHAQLQCWGPALLPSGPQTSAGLLPQLSISSATKTWGQKLKS